MPAVVSNATRIWELNIHWDLFSQCGVWDPKGRGVDIWECIRAHHSTPGTQRVLALRRAAIGFRTVVKHSLGVVTGPHFIHSPWTRYLPKRT